MPAVESDRNQIGTPTGTQLGDWYSTDDTSIDPRCRTSTALPTIQEIPMTGMPSVPTSMRPVPSDRQTGTRLNRFVHHEPSLTAQLSRECQLARVETTSVGDGDHVWCLIDRLPTDLSHDQ